MSSITAKESWIGFTALDLALLYRLRGLYLDPGLSLENPRPGARTPAGLRR